MNAFVGIWIFVAAFAAQMGIEVDASAKVKLTVFYESLCPDSVRFITKQLHPTYHSLRSYMDVEFVPFGKAYISANPWRITCQHGRNECLGNAVQACTLARFPDTDFQVDVVDCFMSEDNPPKASSECSRKLNYNDDGIEDCAVGEEGQQLQMKNREKTRQFAERLRFVPTILFNGEYSSKDQRDALSNLRSVICRKLENPPLEECNK